MALMSRLLPSQKIKYIVVKYVLNYSTSISFLLQVLTDFIPTQKMEESLLGVGTNWTKTISILVNVLFTETELLTLS